MHPSVTLAVFVLAYALIASRRLAVLPIGRPAGALLGAVLMVVTGALAPEEAYAAVDGATLAVLFGAMALSAYVDQSGLFDRLLGLASRVATTPTRLLVVVAIVPGALAAMLLNDAVCLFLTPLVLRLCTRASLPYGPYLVALATSANIGSAATLVGNPQNMLIGSLGGLDFARFFFAVGPAAALCLVLNAALLVVLSRRALPERFESAAEPPHEDTRAGATRFAFVVVTALMAALMLGANLPFAVLGAVLAFVIVDRREPQATFARVDWSLLVFFASLFVVVAGLRTTGYVDAVWAAVAPHVSASDVGGVASFSAAIVVGSNTVSNVPLVLLVAPYVDAMGDPFRTWTLLAWVSTVAGNLTLVGSAANIIVAEQAKHVHELGFWAYARVGALSTLVSVVVGTPLVWWLSG